MPASRAEEPNGDLHLYRLVLAVVECALDVWSEPAVDAWSVGAPDEVACDAPVRDAPVREALAAACAAAHRQDASLVRVLALMKGAWFRACRSRRRTGNEGPDLLVRVITLCIRAYFAPAAATPAARVRPPWRARRSPVAYAAPVRRTERDGGDHTRSAR